MKYIEDFALEYYMIMTNSITIVFDNKNKIKKKDYKSNNITKYYHFYTFRPYLLIYISILYLFFYFFM